MRIILAILLTTVSVFSQSNNNEKNYRWIYQGNFILGDVLSDLCSRSGCSLGISGDVVNLPITLAVKTSSGDVLIKSIRNSLISSGYYLQGTLNGTITIVKDLTADMAVYVDCSGVVQQVPKLHKSAYVKADSIRCANSNKPKIETVSKRWRIEFYSVSETALKQYGAQLSHPLAYGSFDFTNFLKKQHLADSWNIDYLAERDSLFESRSVSFELDSLVNFSWGVQKQVIDKSYIQDGVAVNSYEWRKYGLDLTIKSYPKFKFEYLIRSPDESTISGNSSLGQDSTVFVVASYDLNERGESCFLPFLPIFCKPTYNNERRYFVLRLYQLPEESIRNVSKK